MTYTSVVVGTLPVDLDSNVVKHVHLVHQAQVAFHPS